MSASSYFCVILFLRRPVSASSYFCVANSKGNAVSITPSDPSTDTVGIPGTGLAPSSRGSQSRVDRAHPASIAPGKRPRLTPNPAMAFEPGRRVIPFGSPGGDSQVQAMPQVLLNDSAFGMDPQTAIEAPRFISNGALVTGTVRPDWRNFDMEALEAVLRVNGTETVRRTAGHVAGHPIRPAVDLANALRGAGGIPAGHVVTTGTFTGLVFVRPGDHVEAEFTGFGHAAVRFTEGT